MMRFDLRRILAQLRRRCKASAPIAITASQHYIAPKILFRDARTPA
jgi:hypothetical protein